MTTENEDGSNLNVVELDFEEIKKQFKEFMAGKPQFADYNFEASGLSFFNDVLAYNTHINAFVAHMVHNEGFLDTAVKRESVVSQAKQIDYTPRSVTAARAYVTIAINTTDPVSSIVIDKGTRFSTQIDGITYQFVTTQSYVALPVTPGRFEVENVELVQGRYVTISTIAEVTNELQRFVLGNANADTSTLIVGVQNNINDTATTFFELADDINLIERDSTVYWLQEVEGGDFEVAFGDDILGADVRDGNVVILQYIVTDGEAANDAASFTPIQQVGGYSVANVEIIVESPAAGGADREDIESVRLLAPRGYQTQNRSVTASDYETMLSKDSTIILNADSVTVWGGEDNVPVRYGMTFISLKPKLGRVITSALKDIIVKQIKSKNVITITPEIVDPDYLYLEIGVNFKYDNKQTAKTAGELEQIVRDQITTFNEDTLEFFRRTFRYSKFVAMIDGAHKSITSNLTTLRIKKKLVPRLNVNTQYTIRFENSLVPGTMETSAFIINEPTQTENDVYILRDNGEGVVELYKQLIDLSLVLINDAFGTVDYIQGVVVIDSFAPVALVDSTEMSFTFEPGLNDIFSVRNLIMTIEDVDVTIRGTPLTGTKN